MPRPPASTSRPRSAASAINRLQEALEGTRDRESHLAERVAASVTGGYRSPHAFLRSFKIVAVEDAILPRTALRSSVAPFNLRAFEISAVGKGPSGRSGAFLTPSPPGEGALLSRNVSQSGLPKRSMICGTRERAAASRPASRIQSAWCQTRHALRPAASAFSRSSASACADGATIGISRLANYPSIAAWLPAVDDGHFEVLSSI